VPPMPQTDTDPNGRERDQLLQAIAALQEEQQRLTSLEAGRERAREQSWSASNKLSEANTALRENGGGKVSHGSGGIVPL
jgi:hypothetical protein